MEAALTAKRPPTDETHALTDPAFLEDVRRQMLKFATLQLGDGQLAEDAVQEALLGALKNARSFGGNAALKTWVFAILKHKITDVLRQKQRREDTGHLPREDDNIEDRLFDQRGSWRPEARPQDWGDPEASFQQAQFWRVFEACLDGLPPQQARVFMMREFIGLETGEICAATELSASNLFVLLHRARLRLGKCLEHNWFEGMSC
ncbi:MAG: sigma-70 family RNA polymerase sigma factor [Gammaproteobacteria bacterium]|nr:sigma-70 family RNA polymerase sigma factor [Gammaproteobacteria bacterium]